MLLSLVLSPHFSMLLGWLTPHHSPFIQALAFAFISGHNKYDTLLGYFIPEL